MDLFLFAMEGLWYDPKLSAWFGFYLLPPSPPIVDELANFRYQSFVIHRPEAVEEGTFVFNQPSQSKFVTEGDSFQFGGNAIKPIKPKEGSFRY